MWLGPHNCNNCTEFDNFVNDLDSEHFNEGNFTEIYFLGDLLQSIGSSLSWIPAYSAPMLVFINAERKLPYLGKCFLIIYIFKYTSQSIVFWIIFLKLFHKYNMNFISLM